MDVEAETDALLALHETKPLAGAVDYRGRPVCRRRHGRWLSANFIIGTEVAERFAFYGVSSNLISYLTGPLGESTATAAAAVNVWSGASQLLPLLGACVADSWLGRYRTILFASGLYILDSPSIPGLNESSNPQPDPAFSSSKINHLIPLLRDSGQGGRRRMDVEAETDALLALHETKPLAGAVDYRGRDVCRRRHGRWLSANFIIGTEVAERFAFYGVSSNLISYLTGPLGESTATAAAAVNVWSGASQLLPLLGACVADSWLGRYRTILFASGLYILGLGMVTTSAVLPSDHPTKSCTDINGTPGCRPSASHFQVLAFYISIYMVAFAQGCHKPCVQAFGADQFDGGDTEESAARSSFFNWLRFWMSWGDTVAVVVLSYVQDNVGWGLGFGIPCVVVCFSMVVFLLGMRTYRMYPPENENPFARIGNTFLAMSKEWLAGILPGDRKLVMTIRCQEMAGHVEEAKGILRLFPIWVASLVYAIVFAQVNTLFTKQASTLDRSVGAAFDVPAAALQSLGGVTIIAFIPVYDRVIVPLARRATRLPSGITMLQRIGAGIAVAIVTMAAAALVEAKRLSVARDHGIVDQPDATVPMSLWWIVPQYVLIGVADVLTIVGLQEFFYDQVPDSLRSLGLALYLSILGFGSFLSALLVSVIDRMTRRGGGEGWFSNNLNRAHLDYFYWLLASLSALELVAFLHYAKKYVYKRKGTELEVY